jgi:DNA-binding MarR family transcriptional regulator
VSEDGKYAAVERELTVLLLRGRAMGREFAEQVHPDLDLATYLTLSQIANTAPARAVDLAEFFRVDKAAISRQIRQLEELGLIERTVDPENWRARAVRVTPEGERRLRTVLRTRNTRFRKYMSAWAQDDVDELARLLAMLNDLPVFANKSLSPLPRPVQVTSAEPG